MVLVLSAPFMVIVLIALLILLIFVGIGVIIALACLTCRMHRSTLRLRQASVSRTYDRAFDDEMFHAIDEFLRGERNDD
jgi:hypothetical protein